MYKRIRPASQTSTKSGSRMSTGSRKKVSSSQRSLVNYKRRQDIPKWGFPRRLYIAHKYFETINITCTTGALTGIQISCNGMFDPNITGTGHQPMFFDNCGAIYDHYTVVKSKAKFTVCPNSTVTYPCRVALYADDDTSGPATFNAAVENANGLFKVFNPNPSDPVILFKEWSARSTFGGDPLSNDNLQGTTSANPTEQTVYTLQCDVPSLVTTVFSISVEVIYYAIWDELKTQTEN